MSIQFVSPEQAILIINTYHTAYIESMNTKNRKIRNFSGVYDFITHVIEWNKEQQEIVKKALSENKVKFIDNTWKFILVDDSIENGLPHTIHDCIVLSLRTLNSPNLLSTLYHEKIHTLQKIYPNIFHNLYKSWGWKKLNYVPPLVSENHRVNPDTPDWWFLSKGGFDYIPVVFVKQGATTVNDVDYLFAVYQGSTLISFDKMNRVNWFTDTYKCNCNQCYHPDEITAHLLAQRLYYGEDNKCIESFVKLITNVI
jgi:hypothetical protein